jgi:hypothetical protein
MNPLTLPFRLPLLPLQGVIKLAEILRDEAERQLNDPMEIRRQLEEAEEAHRAGELSSEEVAQVQEAAVRRLTPPSGG